MAEPMPPDPAWAQWNTDFDTFQAAADENAKDTTDYETDQADYQTQLAAFDEFCDTHTPEEALIYFLTIIAASSDPDNHDNILGLYDDQTEIYGDQMTVNANATVLSNDLQSLFNGTSGVPAGQQVDVANDCLAQLTWSLSTDANGNPNDPDVYYSFDPETSSAMLTQLNAMQTTMDTYFSPSAIAYNPELDPNSPDYNPDATWSQGNQAAYDPDTDTCYKTKTVQSTDPTTGQIIYTQEPDPTYGYYTTNQMASFDDMQARMSMKTTGENPATTAMGDFTNESQVLTSISQNMNAALNQEVSQSTGMEKNWESFMGSLIKSMIDETNAAVQNQIRG